jgi:hypothetical protein
MLEASDNRVNRKGSLKAPDALVLSLFARIDILAFAIAAGVVASLAMFLATVSLLLAGAPPGIEVGSNLSALSTFWPGYSVSWPGAFVGAFYGALIGAGAGFVVALFWNFAHLLIVGWAALRFTEFGAD